jgi:chitinase
LVKKISRSLVADVHDLADLFVTFFIYIYDNTFNLFTNIYSINMMHKLNYFFLFLLLIFCNKTFAQADGIRVIAYYSGDAERIDNYPVEKLTHIIFSFSHLKENQLNIDNARDTATIQKLVSLKTRNPNLKVILSLGGWGGCKTCSEIFSTANDRNVFAESVKKLLVDFKADGIDLDWEYPAIEGFPGHKFQPADKENFTSLVQQLRATLGEKYEISFAAGGFKKFIDESVEWGKVMQEVNYVNLMTYDLVNGYATVTGQHTPLYSTPQQMESPDRSVTQLISLGVPKNKIIIGAAFYGRMWENVPDTNFGLYQSGKFKKGVDFKNMDSALSINKGFIYHWDDVANAPFLYNPSQKLFVTFDDKRSIWLKTKYASDKGLGGIMFWELGSDYYKDGLLEMIDEVKKSIE